MLGRSVRLRRLGLPALGVAGRSGKCLPGWRGFCAASEALEEKLCCKKQTSVSMQTLMKTGYGELLDQDAELRVRNAKGLDSQRELVLIQISNFLHREMPVRWARQSRSLRKLPEGLGETRSIAKVQRWYVDAYNTLTQSSPPRSAAENDAFEAMMSQLYTGGKDTLTNMARGLFEWKEGPGRHLNLAEMESVHTFLDQFFVSRIGSRVLIGQYLKLHKQQEMTPDVIGLIRVNTSPLQVALQAAETARFMCMRHYGVAPNVDIMGKTDLTFAYIPAHMYYILFELLKNSMRATVENCMDTSNMTLPDIKVVISDGEQNEDVVIKVSDEGGGIPRSHMPKIFSYLFTTVNHDKVEDRFKFDYFSKESPLAGFGFGLPIARTYARYFGGELQVIPMEGYGTDAYVHLSRITNNEEPLP